MYEKTKLLITLFAVLAIMLITIAILSRFSNNSNSIAIGPKISNISNKAATSITKYNNFSIGYLENLTYPYFVEGNQPKPNGYYDGHFYSGYERYIYTNYSTNGKTLLLLSPSCVSFTDEKQFISELEFNLKHWIYFPFIEVTL